MKWVLLWLGLLALAALLSRIPAFSRAGSLLFSTVVCPLLGICLLARQAGENKHEKT